MNRIKVYREENRQGEDYILRKKGELPKYTA